MGTVEVPLLKREPEIFPADLFGESAVWQLVTYMFVHSGISHIFFNMLTLYFVGVELEQVWGTKYFTKFYFASGIGAGLTQVVNDQQNAGMDLNGRLGTDFFSTGSVRVLAYSGNTGTDAPAVSLVEGEAGSLTTGGLM